VAGRVVRVLVGCVAVGVLTVVAGCRPTGIAGEGPSTTAAPAGDGSIPVADGHGWTSGGLDGTVPAAGSCHTRTAADGEALPDPACTPGAVDAAVSDTDISSTVCRKGGYTDSVRPPESLTNAAKKKLMAAYGIPASKMSDYELDHFIPLNSGGASDIRNLWPEPNTTTLYTASSFVHNDKDRVEEYLYDAICAHKVTVTAVQRAMDTDWTTAVSRLGLPAILRRHGG